MRPSGAQTLTLTTSSPRTRRLTAASTQRNAAGSPRTAADDINGKGGINGYKVGTDIIDDGTTVDRAVTNVRQMNANNAQAPSRFRRGRSRGRAPTPTPPRARPRLRCFRRVSAQGPMDCAPAA